MAVPAFQLEEAGFTRAQVEALSDFVRVVMHVIDSFNAATRVYIDAHPAP